MKKNKKLLIAIAVVAVIVVGFNAFNSYIYNEKQADPVPRVSLSGIVVCLPHKGPGPHTKECSIGLMTPERLHYALDLALMSQMAEPLSVADRISANGVVVPAEDSKYDIEGTFSVTDSLVIE